jgi:hypothetical protein
MRQIKIKKNLVVVIEFIQAMSVGDIDKLCNVENHTKFRHDSG